MNESDPNVSCSSVEISDSEGAQRYYRLSCCSCQGGRRYMEDRIQIDCVRKADQTLDYIYIAVYDGHGGAEACDYVREHLLECIKSQEGFNGSDEEMVAAIRAGFIQTHMEMYSVSDQWSCRGSGHKSTSGTTATCVFVRRGKLFIAHVGDSAAIACCRNGQRSHAHSLTTEHKPDNPIEIKRIKEVGGQIMKKSGVSRVVWKRPRRSTRYELNAPGFVELVPFLSVSRALGDFWSYNAKTGAFIISPEPEIQILDIEKCMKAIVFATDGLLNVLRVDNIASIVLQHDVITGATENYVVNHSMWLNHYALLAWNVLRADNISVVTLMIDDFDIIGGNANVIDVNGDLNFADVFVSNQDSVLVIEPTRCRIVISQPVDMSYYGTTDTRESKPYYVGPGFIGYPKFFAPILRSNHVREKVPVALHHIVSMELCKLQGKTKTKSMLSFIGGNSMSDGKSSGSPERIAKDNVTDAWPEIVSSLYRISPNYRNTNQAVFSHSDVIGFSSVKVGGTAEIEVNFPCSNRTKTYSNAVIGVSAVDAVEDTELQNFSRQITNDGGILHENSSTSLSGHYALSPTLSLKFLRDMNNVYTINRDISLLCMKSDLARKSSAMDRTSLYEHSNGDSTLFKERKRYCSHDSAVDEQTEFGDGAETEPSSKRSRFRAFLSNLWNWQFF